MQVVMQSSTVFGAAGTVENALTGQRYERPPFNSFGDLYVNGSAINLLTSELNVNGASITPATNVNGQNRLPVVPDDLLVGNWPCRRGGLIQLRLVATAAATAFWRVDLESVVSR